MHVIHMLFALNRSSNLNVLLVIYRFLYVYVKVLEMEVLVIRLQQSVSPSAQPTA